MKKSESNSKHEKTDDETGIDAISIFEKYGVSRSALTEARALE